MRSSTILRQTVLMIFTVVSSSFSFAQGNHDIIKATWRVDKFEVENSTPFALKAQQELEGTSLTFSEEELIITKKSGTRETIIKKGQYTFSGNSITLGKDQADILLLSEKNLTIKIPRQGIVYLTRM